MLAAAKLLSQHLQQLPLVIKNTTTFHFLDCYCCYAADIDLYLEAVGTTAGLLYISVLKSCCKDVSLMSVWRVLCSDTLHVF